MTTQTINSIEVCGVELSQSQLMDVANHGMSGGVSGFIYSTELAEAYEQHEDDILNSLDELADELGMQSGLEMVIQSLTRNDDENYYSMQSVKEHAVWMYVEKVAYDTLRQSGHPDYC